MYLPECLSRLQEREKACDRQSLVNMARNTGGDDLDDVWEGQDDQIGGNVPHDYSDDDGDSSGEEGGGSSDNTGNDSEDDFEGRENERLAKKVDAEKQAVLKNEKKKRKFEELKAKKKEKKEKDEKQFTVLTLADTKDDFYQFIGKCVQPELAHCRLGLVTIPAQEKKTQPNHKEKKQNHKHNWKQKGGGGGGERNGIKKAKKSL